MELFILCLLTHQTIGLNHYCPGSLLVSDETIQGGFIDNSIINREDGKVCLCGIRPCIQKCCLQNEIKVNGKCEPEPEKVFDIPIYEEGNEKGNLSNSNFNIITGKDCQGEILRDPEVEIDGIMWIEEEGDLVGNNFTEYCIDTFDDQIGIVFCGNASTSVESNNMKRRVMSVGMIISMPFLLITFIVYALLPDSNVHRRALMFYVLNLLLGYIAMVKVQLSDEYIYPVPCGILAYSIIFFFMVSFCWMNVMCIDMWLAFRGMSGDSGRRGTEKKKMIIYCLYAWCAPAIHTGIVLLINTFANKDLSFYPGIGDEKCFVKDGWPIFMYFYFPMMLVMIVNLILFILTGMKIYRTKKESAVLNRSESRIHHYENHKQQFKLYLTLFFAMGINWSTEFITWALKEHIPQEVVYLTDGINVLYGILIFFIFVFKRRILLSLKKRYYYCIGKPHLAHESSRTRKTVTSTFSNSTVGSSKGNMDYRMEELKNGRLE